jgi:AcrR family transcriptional regulator
MGQVKRLRREKAETTRLKILRAAEAEFTERGYHGATMASIANRAGVAGQTVYFVFHTKSALISALIDLLVMGEDAPEIPQETEWWAAMQTEPDPAESLRHFIRGAAPLFARASTISEILRGAALTDDELRETYDYHEQLRYVAYREVIETVASKGKLRDGLDIDAATDVLLTVYGDSTYCLMTVERGWDQNRVVEWLCDVVPVALLAQATE